MDERNLILFAKDDVKPLLQYLLHTKSFKVGRQVDVLIRNMLVCLACGVI